MGHLGGDFFQKFSSLGSDASVSKDVDVYIQPLQRISSRGDPHTEIPSRLHPREKRFAERYQRSLRIGTPRLLGDRIYLIILDLPNWQARLSRTVISDHVSIYSLSNNPVRSLRPSSLSLLYSQFSSLSNVDIAMRPSDRSDPIL